MSNDESLREHLVRFLDWDNAHLRFDDAVRDFPAALRGTRPAGAPHSPWELLEHLRIALVDILDYTLDSSAVSPEFPAGYWPGSQTPPDEHAWDASVAAYREALGRFARLLEDRSIDLFAPNPDGKTPLREVLLAADHNAYHVGQLVLVRKALGA